MLQLDDIRGISITLEVGDEALLFIHLDQAGNVQRMGTGEATQVEALKQLYHGTSDDHLFESLLGWISDDMLSHTGLYDLPEREGTPCKLQLLFSTDDERTGGYEFLYGTESEGPPIEILDFVVTALDLTDLWFRAQLPERGDEADDSGDEGASGD
ncbi:MAG: hypothetical protein AB7K09_05205 [Planctomycetota bacterium]